MSNPKVIVPPIEEAITLDEARLHLRLVPYGSPPEHPDDPLVAALVAVAREWAQRFTGRCILDQVLELGLDAFPALPWLGSVSACLPGEWLGGVPILLPGAPVTQLESVIYTDGAGVDQELVGYQLDTFKEPPRLVPAPGADWPATQAQRLGAVRVRYRAGYSIAGDSPTGEVLPLSIKQAMLLVLGHLYENRENSADVALTTIPLGAEMLLRPYRLELSLS